MYLRVFVTNLCMEKWDATTIIYALPNGGECTNFITYNKRRWSEKRNV